MPRKTARHVALVSVREIRHVTVTRVLELQDVPFCSPTSGDLLLQLAPFLPVGVFDLVAIEPPRATP